jgi:DNA-damage-inducible protein D
MPMNPQDIKKTKAEFDQILNRLPEGDIEFWFARDLQVHLDYHEWRNFKLVISKAIQACEGAEITAEDHFQAVEREVEIGSGAKRNVQDFMLTRYACYLVAQNGDSRKSAIAFAQSYFATQTRLQEVISEHIEAIERIDAREQLRASEKNLSRNIFERGVDNAGFSRIRSKGDQALFGGRGTRAMKEKLGITLSRPLADFLPAVTIAAKNLAAEITNYNVERDDIQGEHPITEEHVRSNNRVRKTLIDSGITPENLPPSEDIKKVERRVKRQEKKLPKSSGSLPKKE